MKTCYVSTQFGKRALSDGGVFDFDNLYFETIKPVIQIAGMKCWRADELRTSGLIQKATLDAAMNSDLMIADVSSHSANVLYELGIRHAANPGAAIILFNSARSRLPFDVAHIYAIDYTAIGEMLTAEESKALRAKLQVVIDECVQGSGRFGSPIRDLFPEIHVDRPREPCVFIGHGRSKLWARLDFFLRNDLRLKTVAYESSSHVGESIVPILETMLRQATFAVLLLTAEDEVADGEKRARQNVIHEVGLFQGRLGFPRAILLRQGGVAEFSNVAGLQYISFDGESIESAFWELQRVLKREGLVT